MQNGRWNRGALVQWLTHYVSQNGGWVVAVNPARTSQLCHKCGQRVTHPTHELSVCAEHGVMNRDVNADVLHLAAMWGNDLAKDESIRHPNVSEDTLAMVARGDGPVGDNARRELERRRK